MYTVPPLIKTKMRSRREPSARQAKENGTGALGRRNATLHLYLKLQRGFRATKEVILQIERMARENPVTLMSLILHCRAFRRNRGKGEISAAVKAMYCVRICNFELYKANLDAFIAIGCKKDLLRLWEIGKILEESNFFIESPDFEMEFWALKIFQQNPHDSNLWMKYAPGYKSSIQKRHKACSVLAKLLYPDVDCGRLRQFNYRIFKRESMRKAQVFESVVKVDGFAPTKQFLGNLPSRCFWKNRNVFFAWNPDYYLNDVAGGALELQARDVMPHEPVKYYIDQQRPRPCHLVELTWTSIVNRYKRKKPSGRNFLVVMQASTSMFQKRNSKDAASVYAAVSLLLLLTELCKSRRFISFGSEPAWQQLIGDSLLERVASVCALPWSHKTDMDKTWEFIFRYYQACCGQKAPDTLVILSDMQPDATERPPSGLPSSLHVKWQSVFAKNAIPMPTVVYWNIQKTAPGQVGSYAPGVCEVSGFDRSVLSQVLARKIIDPAETLSRALKPFRPRVSVPQSKSDRKKIPRFWIPHLRGLSSKLSSARLGSLPDRRNAKSKIRKNRPQIS